MNNQKCSCCNKELVMKEIHRNLNRLQVEFKCEHCNQEYRLIKKYEGIQGILFGLIVIIIFLSFPNIEFLYLTGLLLIVLVPYIMINLSAESLMKTRFFQGMYEVEEINTNNESLKLDDVSISNKKFDFKKTQLVLIGDDYKRYGVDYREESLISLVILGVLVGLFAKDKSAAMVIGLIGIVLFFAIRTIVLYIFALKLIKNNQFGKLLIVKELK